MSGLLTATLGPTTGSTLRGIADKGAGGFSPASLFAAGEQGAWYDPSDLSTLYQDSAGTTPVTATGQPVGMIKDKSGRGNHATQATTTARPMLQQDSGGRYYLSFDGVDDSLSYSTGSALTKQSAVQASRPIAVSANTYGFSGGTSGTGGINLLIGGAGTYTTFSGTASPATVANSGVSASTSATVIQGGSYDGSSLNSFLNAASPVSAASTMVAGPTSYSIAANTSGSSRRNMRLYGHIHIGRYWTSDAERLSAIRYLAARSGVTL